MADHIVGGDGFAAAINPSNTNIRFATSQNGIQRFDGGSVTNESPPGCGTDDFWYSEVDFDVSDPDLVFVTAKSSRLYRGEWDGSEMDWTDLDTEGELINAIREFTQSEANPEIMYITSKTRIIKTTNLSSSSPNWTPLSFPTVPDGKPTHIVTDPVSSARIWLAFDGYESGKKIYYSPNGGTTWVNETGSLPNIPVYYLLSEPGTTNDGMYAGTELGIFYRNDAIGDWVFFSNGLPPITVYDMDVDNGKLYAATFGRGIWSSDFYSTCPHTVTIIGATPPGGSPPTLGKRNYSASNTINSSQVIKGGIGIDVNYSSGYKMDLFPGFIAKAGSQWQAQIAGCPE